MVVTLFTLILSSVLRRVLLLDGAIAASHSEVRNHHHHLRSQVLLLGLNCDLVGQSKHCQLEVVSTEWQIRNFDSTCARNLNVFNDWSKNRVEASVLWKSLKHV